MPRITKQQQIDDLTAQVEDIRNILLGSIGADDEQD